MNVKKIFWHFLSGVSSSALAQQIFNSHQARVLADGGVIDSEALTISYLIDLIETYGLTSESQISEKIIDYNPSIFGYKVGAGTGVTAGQACTKLYTLNSLADAVQATVGNQPLLLRFDGTNKYYFNPRVSNNSCRTTNSPVTAYNSATDTLRGTFRIFLNNQTTATTDFLGSMGSAANFVIINKGTAMSIRFRGTANAVDSSNFTKPATPWWVRYTINTTQVIYEWSSDNVATAAEVTTWTAIGTQARPTVGTVSATMTICDTAGTQANATSVYYAIMENLTNGTQCIFTPNMYSRLASENFWVDVNNSWSILTDTGVTGLKGLLVDETTITGDGVAYKLRASKASTQPYTVYASIKRLGTGVVYGLAASSQMSNDATNTTLNNGTALSIANTSKLKQLVTAIVNDDSSSLQVDNGSATTGDSGANNGTYIDILANDTTYGNYVLTSLMFVNGN